MLHSYGYIVYDPVKMQCMSLIRRVVARFPSTKCVSIHTRVPVLGGSHSTVGRKQKRKDKVDDHYELIYHLREESIIKILTGTFALATYGGLSALSIQACQYFLANETITQQAVENDLLLSTGLIAMMMPLSILAGKYCQMFPLRIYKHETSYMAIFPSATGLWNRQFEFNKGDLHETTSLKWLPGKVFHLENSMNFFRLENITVCLHHQSFKKPIHLIEMLSNSEKFMRKTKVY